MRKRVLFLIIVLLIFISLIGILRLFLRPKNMGEVNVLNGNWTVDYNGTVYSDVTLSELRNMLGHSCYAGDKIVLSRDLTGVSELIAPTISFETRFSAWKVSFNGQEVRSLYYDRLEAGQFVGCENNFVPLPDVNSFGKLEIELVVAEDNAYSYFEAPLFGGYHGVLSYVIYKNSFLFFTSVFLIVFGVLFFFIAEGFRSSVPEIDMQIFTSLLFICLGLWFLTQFKLLDLFINTGGHQTEIEYISLYLLVPILYMIMGCLRDCLKNHIFFIFAITGSLVALFPIVLHITGVAHINRFLGLIQLDSLVFFIYMLVMLVKDSKTRRITKSQQIQLVGLAILFATFVFNSIFYILETAGITQQIELSKKAVPMGAICLAFAVLANYYIYISESFARNKELASLAHLAYADSLTEIPNRSSYERYVTELSGSKSEYCTISIDLNGLKTVNDVQGHLAGDKYLSEFSRVLAESAKDTGFVARIGGDEFVAILKGENLNRADELINAINTALDKLNKTDPSIKRSAAAGYAFSSEVPESDWHAVYLLADERMYKQKERMHAARKN